MQVKAQIFLVFWLFTSVLMLRPEVSQQTPETPTPVPLSVDEAVEFAHTPVAQNSDWTPYEHDFDGVTMVLVPAGCFEMGADEQSEDAAPAHEICFAQPFWIDRYEVSNAQFAQFEGLAEEPGFFAEDDRPREEINWTEARDFCVHRDSRLPTEAEWEYAARGPDGLLYPWGNEWDEARVIWSRPQTVGTDPVDSTPEGQSWVGALHLSGNVWEWVNTLYGIDLNHNYDFTDEGDQYFGYPYDPADGREESPSEDDAHVLRGGSWFYEHTTDFMTTARNYDHAYSFSFTGGFRCARSLGGDVETDELTPTPTARGTR